MQTLKITKADFLKKVENAEIVMAFPIANDDSVEKWDDWVNNIQYIIEEPKNKVVFLDTETIGVGPDAEMLNT